MQINQQLSNTTILGFIAYGPRTHILPPGGGNSHLKQTGMLVVSLRGVNFGFLVSLRVFRAQHQYIKSPQDKAKRNRRQIFFLTCFVFVFECF